MQIRTAILALGAAAAMVAPNAFGHIPSDEINGGSATLAVHTQSFNSVDRRQHKSKAKAKAAKANANVSHVVTMIVEPMLPSSDAVPAVPDPNQCQETATNCTDQQLCEQWGENCDVWYAEEAAQTVAANEQQAADGSSTSSSN